jgi:hypothetical protein
MRSVGLLLTMFSLFALPALTACGEDAPAPPETTTVGVGPATTPAHDTPRVVVVPSPRPEVVVVEAPAPRPTVVVQAPPSVTVRAPAPPSITITPPAPPGIVVE